MRIRSRLSPDTQPRSVYSIAIAILALVVSVSLTVPVPAESFIFSRQPRPQATDEVNNFDQFYRIPDFSSAGRAFTLQVDGTFGPIADLNISFDGAGPCDGVETGPNELGFRNFDRNNGINHPWVGDLTATLISPEGTVVTLFDRINNGGNGTNFCQTILDDEATNSIQTVRATNEPFSGTWRPFQNLSAFDGEDANGIWTLRIADLNLQDEGSLEAFSLHIQTLAGAPVVTPDAPPRVEFVTPGFDDITNESRLRATGLAFGNGTEIDRVDFAITRAAFNPAGILFTPATQTVEGSWDQWEIDVPSTDASGGHYLHVRAVNANGLPSARAIRYYQVVPGFQTDPELFIDIPEQQVTNRSLDPTDELGTVFRVTGRIETENPGSVIMAFGSRPRAPIADSDPLEFADSNPDDITIVAADEITPDTLNVPGTITPVGGESGDQWTEWVWEATWEELRESFGNIAPPQKIVVVFQGIETRDGVEIGTQRLSRDFIVNDTLDLFEPQVTITQPEVNIETFDGRVTVSGTASDRDSSIECVQVRVFRSNADAGKSVDSTKGIAFGECGLDSPFFQETDLFQDVLSPSVDNPTLSEWSFEVGGLEVGENIIEVRAVDSDGIVSTSARRIITVVDDPLLLPVISTLLPVSASSDDNETIPSRTFGSLVQTITVQGVVDTDSYPRDIDVVFFRRRTDPVGDGFDDPTDGIPNNDVLSAFQAAEDTAGGLASWTSWLFEAEIVAGINRFEITVRDRPETVAGSAREATVLIDIIRSPDTRVPPLVTITSPSADVSVDNDITLFNVQGTASDPDGAGQLSIVEYRQGATVGTIGGWQPAFDVSGDYTRWTAPVLLDVYDNIVQVRSTDPDGLFSPIDTVVITRDDSAPTVAVTTPGLDVNAGNFETTIEFNGTAADVDGDIVRVRYRVGRQSTDSAEWIDAADRNGSFTEWRFVAPISEGTNTIDIQSIDDNGLVSDPITARVFRLRSDAGDDLFNLTRFTDIWQSRNFAGTYQTPRRMSFSGFRFEPGIGERTFAGFFDNDDKTDFATVTSFNEAWISRNDGELRLEAPIRQPAVGWLEDPENGSIVRAGDFNGDDLTDLLQLSPEGNLAISFNSGGMLPEAVSAGNTTLRFDLEGGLHIDIGDVDGNGFDDIIMLNNNDTSVNVAFNTGAGTFNLPGFMGFLGFMHAPDARRGFHVADFNADGRDDFAEVFDGFIRVATTRPGGFGSNSPAVWGNFGFRNDPNLRTAGQDGGWWTFPADVNGDGAADMVQITNIGDAWVALSNARSEFIPPLTRNAFLGFRHTPDGPWQVFFGDAN